jgi:class 3 adenylate cyclase
MSAANKLRRRAGAQRRSGTEQRAERARTSPADRVRASVVCADLRGLMQVAVRGDRAVVTRYLEEFFSSMADVAVGHRASIERLAGDVLVLVHGVPRPRRDDPVRALRAALDIQGAFLSLRNRWLREERPSASELGVGVAVATGDVLVTSLETGSGETALIGEPLKRAERLSGIAQHAEVLVDEATYTAVAESLDSEVMFRPVRSGASRDGATFYRARPQRARLRVVASRGGVISRHSHRA